MMDGETDQQNLVTPAGVTPPTEAIKGQSYAPSVTFQPPSKDALKLRLEGNNVARSNLATVPEARAVLQNERH